MILGLDLDGVLFDFSNAYADILEKHSDVRFPYWGPGCWPGIWYWERALGVTKEEEAKAWAEIKASTDFWRNLDLLPHAKGFLEELAYTTHEVYFITDRPGTESQWQTQKALDPIYKLPNVIISRKGKGIVCKALGIDVYIDDKVENIEDVWAQSPQTQAYLLKYPYNSKLHESMGPNAVDSLEEFAQKVRLWEG